jgi:AraC-like DNA-binding protein
MEADLSFLHYLISSNMEYFKIPNDPGIGACMGRIINENKLKRSNYQLLGSLYFLELILMLSRYLNKQRESVGQLGNKYLVKAINLIQANYCSGLSVSELAMECRISTRYLGKLFNSYLGLTPHQYCNALRLQKAVELLANSSIPVKEIAYTVGYSTPQYFSRVFKEEYGFSPKTYRKLRFES